MGPADGLLVAGAGVLAGAVNAIAGGGTLIAFPALLATGMPALTANITSSVGLVTGYAGGALGYRRELRGQRSRLLALAPPAMLGGIVGAVVLLITPSDAFKAAVPYLVMVSCALLAAQSRLAALVARRRDAAATANAAAATGTGGATPGPTVTGTAPGSGAAAPTGGQPAATATTATTTTTTTTTTAAAATAMSAAAEPASPAGTAPAGTAPAGTAPAGTAAVPTKSAAGTAGAQATTASGAGEHPVTWPTRIGVFLAGVYGSYFGAGLGVLLLGVLGILLVDELQRTNALKTLLSFGVNAIGVVIFLVTAKVSWAFAGILVVASALGGVLGARVARLLPAPVLRAAVITLGLVVAVVLLIRN